jgi:hypothetical protein
LCPACSASDPAAKVVVTVANGIVYFDLSDGGRPVFFAAIGQEEALELTHGRGCVAYPGGFAMCGGDRLILTFDLAGDVPLGLRHQIWSVDHAQFALGLRALMAGANA